ncbi:hypothetical protein HELRODRAFT_62632 [Helobdella robusta]|uniref:Transmembrane protein 222 n=1 Tax=Helobdella robusta TaxID=6412 RepID=T1FX29_HELRO|nr:hypothetical protein HELRODRAFT_62632 [Helobdella robusta]ESO12120.1 hypothetical protein HELRODRAFT_62632 [Helobdella robusta]
MSSQGSLAKNDIEKNLYPHSIVWTPIPILTWFIPCLGHMGICTTNGIIRDFAGPYYVSENHMAFGNPTKFWQMDLMYIPASSNLRETWDRGVYEASEVYKGRMHNLFCDNCHSHVAMALNEMRYKNKSNWNMVSVWFAFTRHSRYVSFGRLIKTWIPFIIIMSIIVTIALVANFKKF